jgi:hypothetical protein
MFSLVQDTGPSRRCCSIGNNCIEVLPVGVGFRTASNPSGSCVEVLPAGARFATASGTTSCVEALPAGARFISASGATECVEVLPDGPFVRVKDSKDHGVMKDGKLYHTTLHVPVRDWQMFLSDIRADTPVYALRGVRVAVKSCRPDEGKEGTPLEHIFTVDGDPDRLVFTQAEWYQFCTGVREGVFDLALT